MAKFSKVVENNSKMAKISVLSGFLVAKFLQFILIHIARFLYCVLACSQKCEGM
jgi:hypothetical protein